MASLLRALSNNQGRNILNYFCKKNESSEGTSPAELHGETKMSDRDMPGECEGEEIQIFVISRYIPFCMS